MFQSSDICLLWSQTLTYSWLLTPWNWTLWLCHRLNLNLCECIFFLVLQIIILYVESRSQLFKLLPSHLIYSINDLLSNQPLHFRIIFMKHNPFLLSTKLSLWRPITKHPRGSCLLNRSPIQTSLKRLLRYCTCSILFTHCRFKHHLRGGFAHFYMRWWFIGL